MRTKNAVTLFFILVIVFAVLTACQPVSNDPSLKAQEYIGLDENIDRKKLKELVGVDPAPSCRLRSTSKPSKPDRG